MTKKKIKFFPEKIEPYHAEPILEPKKCHWENPALGKLILWLQLKYSYQFELSYPIYSYDDRTDEIELSYNFKVYKKVPNPYRPDRNTTEILIEVIHKDKNKCENRFFKELLEIV